MSVKVTVSGNADADLLLILTKSIESWGANRAVEYRLGLNASIAMLGDHPEIGKRLPNLGSNVRRQVYESHIIVYENTSDGQVLILRVVHGSRRLTKRLLSGPD